MHVRTIRSLRDDRSLRRSERMFVLEGVRLVADLLTSGAMPVLALYDAAQLMRTSAGQHLLAQLHTLPHCHAASTAVVNAASDTTNPQGVVAVARWPHHVPPPHPQLVSFVTTSKTPAISAPSSAVAMRWGSMPSTVVRGAWMRLHPKQFVPVWGA
ncbi:MAG: hypothetical protein ACKO83_07995 [Roseiflexaceae bacterium]